MKKVRRIFAMIGAVLVFAVLLGALVCGAACAEGVLLEELPTEFFDWTSLGGYAGAMLATMLVTQLTKEIKYIKAIPTQLWSWLIAVVILILAEVFSGKLTAASAVLCLLNGAIVSLGANGGYSMITRVKRSMVNNTDAEEPEEPTVEGD